MTKFRLSLKRSFYEKNNFIAIVDLNDIISYELRLQHNDL